MYKTEYEKWLNSPAVDEKTKEELKKMADEEISDCFYRNLEFGTGGMRGILGVGTNRINVYTVRKITQGLANEIKEIPGGDKMGVVISYDSRKMSEEFAKECASVLSANGITAYVFDSLRATPELSFAVRYLKCIRGIMITASHNPKEYNGYKIYAGDGCQLPPEPAERIAGYIDKIDIFADIKISENPSYKIVGKEIDDAYINAVLKESLGVKIPENMRVVYTPLHGTGNIPVRRILSEIGVKNAFVVPEQELPDGDFKTVKSPNPEDSAAMSMAIEYAKRINADLVLGTDPDCDRVGIAVKNRENEYVCLNGNQTGALMCEFILRKLSEENRIPKNGTVVKTIVTTDIIEKITAEYGVGTVNVLTGFKYIGEKIGEFEKQGNEERFIFGLEESYGYLKGTYARDKDAVVASMLICQMTADYIVKGKSVYDGMADLYKKYGYSEQLLKTYTIPGASGAEKIKHVMSSIRNNPFSDIAGFKVIKTEDYENGINNLPKSNVIKLITENGWIAIRPSGTEPKLKLYFEIFGKEKARVKEDMLSVNDDFEKKTEKIINEG